MLFHAYTKCKMNRYYPLSHYITKTDDQHLDYLGASSSYPLYLPITKREGCRPAWNELSRAQAVVVV